MLELASHMLHFRPVDQMIQQFGSWQTIIEMSGIKEIPAFLPVIRDAAMIDPSFDKWQTAFLRQVQKFYLNIDVLFSQAEIEEAMVVGRQDIASMSWSVESSKRIEEALDSANRLLREREPPEGIRETIKAEFGDWYKVLYSIGVPIIKRARGTVVHAVDGHLCLSVFEKVVDDVLYANRIPHEREGRYPTHPTLNPRGLMRSDWQLRDGTIIEYFGLAGDKMYDEKTTRKIELCKELGLRLVAIYGSSDLEDFIVGYNREARKSSQRTQ